MPTRQPNAADVHVDALLTMLSIAFMNSPDAYIADKLFPSVTVAKQSGLIPEYRRDDAFRDVAQVRAPGTESEGHGFRVVHDQTYYCMDFATHVDVPDEVRANADDPYNPDRDATRMVINRLKLKREISWATDFFTTGIWTTDVTGGTNFTAWDNYAASDIIGDVQTGVDAVHRVTAVDPKKLAWGRQVWSKVRHHPDFLERIKYTQKAILTADLIASILDLDQLLVGNAIKATANEAAAVASQTYDYIFGNDALLLYVPAAPSLMTPAAGYTFHWSAFGALSWIRRIRDDKAMYDRIEGHTHFDQKKVGADLGYFFSGCVST
jgi:hypothetical protein